MTTTRLANGTRINLANMTVDELFRLAEQIGSNMNAAERDLCRINAEINRRAHFPLLPAS